MGDTANNLAKATDTLLRTVVEAAVASIEVKRARTPGAVRPDLFEIAQVHRQAEKRAHELLDEAIKAAAAAWEAGDITLASPPAQEPAT